MKRFYLIATVLLVAVLIIVGTTAVFGQSGNQWRVDYYPNTNWAGNPVLTQFTSALNFNWGTGSPGPNMPVDNWTMRATSTAYFYSGVYQFNILADDEVTLTIDNVVWLNTVGQGQSGKTQIINIPMTQGNHNIQVDFREFTGTAYLYVTWGIVKDGTVTPAPPPNATPLPYPLVPSSETSVQTKYGDYTPCIQQNSHQSNCFVSDGAWNSPNLGSIQMEPKIEVWQNCEPADKDVTWTTDPNTDPITTHVYRCSKTLAGWFPT